VFPPQMRSWNRDPGGENLEFFIPFLGKYHRRVSRRCCQTCTPRSWVRDFGIPGCHSPIPGALTPVSFPSPQDGFYPEDHSALGFRDLSRLTEADTRFRGWLVRRVCGFLAAWEWEIPVE
ncbi:GPAT2 acyltransferase, partial [Grallaria varia]|nr:GPAT2 acyltransferase [Grallaria varia]